MRQNFIFIKNESGSSIDLPEIGGYTLAPGSEIDLTDPDLGDYYRDSISPMRALYSLTGTVLYQKMESGDLSIRVEPNPEYMGL